MPYHPATRSEIEKAVANSPRVRAHLRTTAREASAAVLRLAPQLSGGRRIRITNGTRMGTDGRWEGFVKVAGWNWHLPEFGALTWKAQPYIRPGVATAIARRGGRMKEIGR